MVTRLHVILQSHLDMRYKPLSQNRIEVFSMGMLLRHRPNNAAPSADDEFYKKAEQAYKEQQAKEQAAEADSAKAPSPRGRKRRTE